MSHVKLHQLLERIGNLLRTEARKSSTAFGLQPVHIEALDYLSRCNRYSDTPAAVTDYLGATKGTVSQTLRVLERKGLIEKKTDKDDRRVLHLNLTELGHNVLSETSPPAFFGDALSDNADPHSENLEAMLANLLQQMQRANHSKSFGVCKTCRFFRSGGAGHQCGLTLEPLDGDQIKKICREHEATERQTPLN